MKASNHLLILSRRISIIVVCCAIVLATVSAGNQYIPRVYSSSATLRVATIPQGSSDFVSYDIQYSDRVMNTYAKLAVTDEISQEMMKKLGLAEAPEVKAEILANTELIVITADASSPELAQTIANTLAEVMIARSKSLASNDSQAQVNRGMQEQLLIGPAQDLAEVRQQYETVLSTTTADKASIDLALQALDFKERVYAAKLDQANRTRSLLLDSRTIANRETLTNEFNLVNEDLKTTLDDLNSSRTAYEQLLMNKISKTVQLEVSKQKLDFAERIYTSAVEQVGRTRLAESSRSAVSLLVVNPAQLSPSPTSPNVLLNSLLGLLAGLVVGVGLAYLFDRLDSRIRTVEQLQENTDFPVLCALPTVQGRLRRRLGNKRMVFTFNTPQAEALRQLSLRLRMLNVNNSPKVLLVTSSKPGDGKTTTATNLAVSLTRHGKRVLLVDADLHRPSIHKYFDLSNVAGFSTLLNQSAELDELVRHPNMPNLYVLTSGPVDQRAGDWLGSSHLSEALSQMRVRFDTIILDSPPLEGVADALELAHAADGVLVVVDQGTTTVREIKASTARLLEFQANIIGFVLNRSETTATPKYGDTTGIFAHDFSAQSVQSVQDDKFYDIVKKRSDRKADHEAVDETNDEANDEITDEVDGEINHVATRQVGSRIN